MTRYNEVVRFIETNHRNPSKYVGSEREHVNWTKQQRKLMNAGELKEPRLEMFKELMELSEKYKRKKSVSVIRYINGKSRRIRTGNQKNG